MRWLGRLTGKEPPRVPAGGRAFVSLDEDGWSIRVRMVDGAPANRCKRIGPTFDGQVNAYAYLDWINGGPVFRYPEGRA